MCVWTEDADAIKWDDKQLKMIYANQRIKDYLHSNRKLGVAATKGQGKTFLIKAKRAQYQALSSSVDDNNIACFPKDDMVDTLDSTVNIDKSLNKLLCNYPEWVNLWKRETASGAETRARFIGKHLFASKIYCAECGSIYRHGYADRAKTVDVYRDTFGIKSIDKDIHCVNKKYSRIYEKDMKTMTVAAYNGLVQGGNTYFDMLLQAIEHELMKDVDLTKRKRTIQTNISKIEARMKKIASSFVDATPLMGQALNDELTELKKSADRLNEEILRIENKSENKADRVRRVQEIKERLNEWSVITVSGERTCYNGRSQRLDGLERVGYVSAF